MITVVLGSGRSVQLLYVPAEGT